MWTLVGYNRAKSAHDAYENEPGARARLVPAPKLKREPREHTAVQDKQMRLHNGQAALNL